MNPDDNQNFVPRGKEESSLESLQKHLYSRGDVHDDPEARTHLKPHFSDVPRDFADHKEFVRSKPLLDSSDRLSLLKKLFIVSLLFFFLSIAVAGYVFFIRGNYVSSNNVSIDVIGPVAVPGGDVLPLEVEVTNQNNTDLESADLVIEYPDGTRESSDVSIPLKRYREALGPVPKGSMMSKKVKAILFGEEKDQKEISISVEYKIKGSNATFYKTKTYDVTISSAPVTMTVTGVKEVNANQDVEFLIDVISNSSASINNVSVSANYPFGFTFKDADPAPTWSNSFWSVGDLRPGVKRTIKVRGSIAGQDNDERTFRFSVGTESPTKENVIGTAFLTSTQKVMIRKPFFGGVFALNGDVGQVTIVQAGKAVHGNLSITNNIGTKITDVRVSIVPSGSIYIPESITANDGFYRSSDNNILWDQTIKPELALLNPDEQKTVGFSFNIAPLSKIQTIKNPEMKFLITLTGKRINEGGVSQEVTSSFTRTIRVGTNLGIFARALHGSGPFTNSGPVPPRVDQETTYTIVWTLTNGSNAVSSARVSAILPSYMKWLNASVPQSEAVQYNQTTGEISWDVGDVDAGTGLDGNPREVSFQVSLTPSLSQVNTLPSILGETKITGTDPFVNVTLQGSARSLTTDLSNDSTVRTGQGLVGR